MKWPAIKILSFVSATFLIVLLSMSCQNKGAINDGHGKIKVVTTLFPLYDFAKKIGGDKASVSLLLPPGVEAHAFEPGPSDISKIQNADLFIFTGPLMEPWVERLLKGIDIKKMTIVDTSFGIDVIYGHRDHAEDSHPHLNLHDGSMLDEYGSLAADPHIWLDFSNAGKMVSAITEAFIKRDPGNRDIYFKNGEAYKKELDVLDAKYKKGLSRCKSRVIIHAGHFAFGYLAKRYDLKYISAYKGFMPDAEPTPKRIAEIIKSLKKYDLKSIYYEELITPKVADTISKETGCNLLMLHGAHNISKEDLNLETSFIHLMEKNLEHLRIGMQCQ